jgi:hypothetical protein
LKINFSLQANDPEAKSGDVSAKPSALDVIAHLESEPRKNLLDRLFRWWFLYGELLTHSGAKYKDIRKFVNRLPVSSKKKWQKALLTKPPIYINSDPTPIHETKSADEAILLDQFLDLYLYDYRDGNFDPNISVRSDVVVDSKMEICRVDCFDTSSSFNKAVEFWGADIPARTEVEKVWKTRFLPLLQNSKTEIVVVDRFAANRFLEKLEKKEESGLERFIKKLYSANRMAKVVVYSAYSKFDADHSKHRDVLNHTQKCFKDRIAKEVSIDPNRPLVLHLVRDDLFMRIFHDRYIRSGKLVMELGLGLAVLEGRSTNMNFASSLNLNGHKRRDEVEAQFVNVSSKVSGRVEYK